MDEQTRAQSVAQCKWVDSVICPAPWIVDDKFLEANGIDFLAHDAAPYASADGTDCYALVKSKGMFLATERTDGISTSDIIVQIVRDCTYTCFLDNKAMFRCHLYLLTLIMCFASILALDVFVTCSVCSHLLATSFFFPV